MSNLNEEAIKIRNEWARLKIQWEKTSEQWNDKTKIHFKKEFWQKLEREVPILLKEFDTMERIISKTCREFGT